MDDAGASTSWTPPARCCPTEWPTASPSSWPNSLRRAGRGAGAPNLSLGVANSIAGVKAGARQIDGTSCALGAVAGHSPTEILAGAFERLGVATRVDTDAVLASPRK
ncbi:hypothetical protein [Rhodococcus koreensis]|uniref:hypothetical protein n=1 Tax=Rhodococcus koreensis TaxID=99653 RepID=UPI000933B146|nr:hypothetical protein [Rhodococcus koreensis]